MNGYSKEIKIFVPVIILIIALPIGLSLWITKGGWLPIKLPDSQVPSQTVKVSPLFDFQTASMTVNIEKVAGLTLTVNKKGQIEKFPVSSKLSIYKYRPGTTEATSSSDLKEIDVGKEVRVTLVVEDGEYKVTSLIYPIGKKYDD